MENTVAKFNLPKTSSFPLQADNEHHHYSIVDSNHQSAELIGSNDDLITVILHRLPAKSIIRFKSVSKRWLSLLTQSCFTLMFDRLLKSSGLYFLELHLSFDLQNPITPPFRTLDLCHDTRGMEILQSCNGLLLLRCDREIGCCDKYYVFNPTTKNFAVIPPFIGGPHAERLIRFLGLAYHPTECVHYKLVCILRAGNTMYGEGSSEEGHRMYNIQIYSSHTKTWKKLNQTFTPNGYTEFRYGVYWNGAFHWAPLCRNPMYLTLDTEQIQELPLPVKGRYYSLYATMPLYFGESRGHLHLVDTLHEKDSLSMNVYEMLRDHSGWFLRYQLDLHELCVAYPNMTHTQKWGAGKHEFRVLDVVRGEKEEDTFIVVKVVDDIKRYNILDKTFQQLFCVPDKTDYVCGNFGKTFDKTFHRFVGHRYIEKVGSI